ncbi:MAG: hypothetical protein ACJAT2_001669 [Bacteriovoracaceae bacterium]|jgi:hypothetical protein
MRSIDHRTKTEKAPLSIALLMEDISEAKEISDILRKTGVLPYIYQDLKTFWFETLEKIPSLCIIDVKMMTEGELLLKNHPYIKNEQLPLAFYHRKETEPLLYSTYEIFNFGTVNKEQSLKGQLKSLLRRFNKMRTTEEEKLNLNIENKKLSNQVGRIVASHEKGRENEFYDQLLKSIVGRLEIQKKAEDFYSAAEVVLSSVKEIKQFSILELSHNAQKLVSPKLFHSKFCHVPSLWLGQTSNNGIEFFAQNMASQVVLDLMGGDIMSLNIRDRDDNPKLIIFVKVDDQDFLTNFDWELLERYLSGYLCHFLWKQDSFLEKDETIWNPWQLFSKLDQVRFGKLNSDPDVSEKNKWEDEYTLLDIDFSNLIGLVREKKLVRFYWNQFFQEFFSRMINQKKMDAKICPIGVEHVGLLVRTEEAMKVMNDVKAFALRYPYWRYFEDADIILSRNMKPEVKMIPLSKDAYMNFLDSLEIDEDFDFAKPLSLEEKPKIWRPAPRLDA